MAEPFGIAAGSIGIATAFTACIDCFEYIQLGRQFGRDFQTDQLALSCARVRLARWGESVDVYNDPKLGKPDATDIDVQLGKDVLFQILLLFADTEGISRKYRLNAQVGEDLSTYSQADMDGKLMALENNMKQLAIRRQKGARVLQLARWAIYHRSQLKNLLESVVALIENLEKMFPAPAAQIKLVREEAAAIGHSPSLETISAAAQGVDNLLRSAAQEVLMGHQYLDVTIEGQGQLGDAISDDWKGSGSGRSHIYNGVVVKKGGRGLLGDNLGGKDFWDS